jgi:maltooligosyltrehalose trehalohydrolase
MNDLPPLGAVPDPSGTTFRVWSTRSQSVGVRLFDGPDLPQSVLPLEARGDGHFELHASAVAPGALYKFVLDGEDVVDPYARFLPYGVHGPAEVIAPMRGRALSPALASEAFITYELHVGAFTPEGTFAAAAQRLPDVAALGVTAIELMPLSAFAGEHGWGYDGVGHFGPHAPYGRPEDLERLVETAHRLGLAVLLDVVYNHFGPSGNYLARYSPEYFTTRVPTPWGSAPDFTQRRMRAYVIHNARMWLHEYGFDGLRLDATHAIVETPETPILRELRSVASAFEPPRRLVAEDERNAPSLVTEIGLDGIWADDFHHHVRALLAGDRDGYYAAYEPTVAALAHVIERGWSYEGQGYLPWSGKARGRPADALRPEHFVYCIENHDQAGNRAFGERLSQDVSPAAYCAASALLLFLPMSPLLFMGQEWGASTPFLYFTDHEPELGALVAKGRRDEFKAFRAFADAAARDRIPDPQAPESFQRSKLRWEERDVPDHARVLRAVRDLLRLRREDAVLSRRCERRDLRARAEGGVLVVERSGEAGRRALVVNFGSGGETFAWERLGRPLFATGPTDAGTLAASSAIVLAG